MSFLTESFGWFSGLLSGSKAIVDVVWMKVKGMGLWLFGVVIALAAAAKGLLVFAIASVNMAIEKIGEGADTTDGLENDFSIISLNIRDIMEFGNYFFPFETLFAMVILLTTLWVIAMVYRLIKSWIFGLS